MFENVVASEEFGSKRDEVTGGWMKIYNGKHYNLYASQNISWIIKSARITWAGHAAGMGQMKLAYKCLSKNLKANYRLSNLGVKLTIILDGVLKKRVTKMSTD
jgi:hypothetical protein